MANKLYEENDIQSIANAIRVKNGSSDKYMVSQMADAIANLQITSGDGDGIIPTGTITITSNGTHDVTNYASALVNVEGGASSELPSNVKTGVLHLESDSTEAVTITHGCGKVPSTVIVYPLSHVVVKGTVGGTYADGATVGLSSLDDGTNVFSLNVNSIVNVNETTFEFTPRSASYPLIGGYDYLWVAY